jgi:opacity protein-like surface antigen
MRPTVVAMVATLTSFSPGIIWAQASPPLTAEASIGVGLGHVFRYEDQGFGDRLNAGGSASIVHRSRFAFELEGNRTRELSPVPTPCGIVGVTCVGVGHDGPRSVMSVSANLQYRFRSGQRIQPYVLAGLGVMRSTSAHSITRVSGTQAIVAEDESRDTGFGPDLGAGIRVRLSKTISISPEIRWLDASLLSRENLAVTRVTIRAAYAW